MITLTLAPATLRPAWLRGICPEGQPPHAVLALAPRQFLLLPMRPAELAAWADQIGQRVWLDAAQGRLHREPGPQLRPQAWAARC